MSCSPGTVDFIREQAEGAGEVSTRAMFGEYALYLDGRVVALICDDRLYLKDTPGARALFPEAELAPPYPGAKPHLVGDPLLDDPARLADVARAVLGDLPPAKSKKAKPKKAKKPKG